MNEHIMASLTTQLMVQVSVHLESTFLSGGKLQRPDKVVEAGAASQMEMLHAYMTACVRHSKLHQALFHNSLNYHSEVSSLWGSLHLFLVYGRVPMLDS